jgi:hypothetical protein
MKRVVSLVLAASLLAALSGCVYQPPRSSVVYDDGTVVAGDAMTNAGGYADDGYGDDGYAYAPAYYGGYYGPWCCYGAPWIGLGFYGSYYYGHGYYGHGYYGHGGNHWHGGGGWHGSAPSGGHWHGH